MDHVQNLHSAITLKLTLNCTDAGFTRGRLNRQILKLSSFGLSYSDFSSHYFTLISLLTSFSVFSYTFLLCHNFCCQITPEDQWSCKRSPEICCIYQYTFEYFFIIINILFICQFPSTDILTVLPIQRHRRQMLTLLLNRSRSYRKIGQGHHRVMIYIYIVVLESSILHAVSLKSVRRFRRR